MTHRILEPDKIMTIYDTSRATGNSKNVMLFQRNLILVFETVILDSSASWCILGNYFFFPFDTYFWKNGNFMIIRVASKIQFN